MSSPYDEEQGSDPYSDLSESVNTAINAGNEAINGVRRGINNYNDRKGGQDKGAEKGDSNAGSKSDGTARDSEGDQRDSSSDKGGPDDGSDSHEKSDPYSNGLDNHDDPFGDSGYGNAFQNPKTDQLANQFNNNKMAADTASAASKGAGISDASKAAQTGNSAAGAGSAAGKGAQAAGATEAGKDAAAAAMSSAQNAETAAKVADSADKAAKATQAAAAAGGAATTEAAAAAGTGGLSLALSAAARLLTGAFHAAQDLTEGTDSGNHGIGLAILLAFLLPFFIAYYATNNSSSQTENYAEVQYQKLGDDHLPSFRNNDYTDEDPEMIDGFMDFDFPYEDAAKEYKEDTDKAIDEAFMTQTIKIIKNLDGGQKNAKTWFLKKVEKWFGKHNHCAYKNEGPKRHKAYIPHEKFEWGIGRTYDYFWDNPYPYNQAINYPVTSIDDYYTIGDYLYTKGYSDGDQFDKRAEEGHFKKIPEECINDDLNYAEFTVVMSQGEWYKTHGGKYKNYVELFENEDYQKLLFEMSILNLDGNYEIIPCFYGWEHKVIDYDDEGEPIYEFIYHGPTHDPNAECINLCDESDRHYYYQVVVKPYGLRELYAIAGVTDDTSEETIEEEEGNENDEVTEEATMLEGDTVKEKIWNFFVSKGLTSAGIAGILGNISVETGGTFRTDLRNSSDHYGLCQWSTSRQKGLKKLATKRETDTSDLQTQLEYIWEELTTTYTGTLNTLKTTSSIKEASDAFCVDFERPAKRGTAAETKECTNRGKRAQDLYSELNGTTSSGSTPDTNTNKKKTKVTKVGKSPTFRLTEDDEQPGDQPCFNHPSLQNYEFLDTAEKYDRVYCRMDDYDGYLGPAYMNPRSKKSLIYGEPHTIDGEPLHTGRSANYYIPLEYTINSDALAKIVNGEDWNESEDENIDESKFEITEDIQEILDSLPDDATKEVIEEALSHLGMNYVWGSNGPNKFDCSGLVQYCYKQVGISLPHSAQGQYNVTSRKSVNDIQPGDLVFKKKGDRISHVGIYMGGGMVVEASGRKNGIKTTPMKKWVNASNFAGVGNMSDQYKG